MGVAVTARGDGILVGSGAPVLLCATNQDRDAVIIHNQNYTLYVKCGMGASASDFTYLLTSRTTLEITNFVGPITAIASGDSTYVRVTELL